MNLSFLSGIAPKAALLAFVFAASACGSKKDDSAPASVVVELPAAVVSTYSGQLSYTSAASPIGTANGRATIAKTGDKTYSITFSDGVPALTGLKFQTATGSSYATVASDGSTAGMTISPTTLNVGVTKGSETWGFSGDK